MSDLFEIQPRLTRGERVIENALVCEEYHNVLKVEFGDVAALQRCSLVSVVPKYRQEFR